ncbi:conserved hypothetical protein [Aspergillus terreus NIH2624]|uniref:Secreted protein n=1 Tax=Aspergillus terreus (strain NIH 2624 / FGSC A1156) TaxID=341663 RepID=Q0CG26_ASPTN|nr:uncharacterized protein ATEG_07366 [Aspergillus terreus NIH2624]EAU32750.1 conserved hypothetical protein [Aspergillus terreus NIH2624]
MRIPIALQFGLLVLVTAVLGLVVLSIATISGPGTRGNGQSQSDRFQPGTAGSQLQNDLDSTTHPGGSAALLPRQYIHHQLGQGHHRPTIRPGHPRILEHLPSRDLFAKRGPRTGQSAECHERHHPDHHAPLHGL